MLHKHSYEYIVLMKALSKSRNYFHCPEDLGTGKAFRLTGYLYVYIYTPG